VGKLVARILQLLFFVLLVRPFIFVVLGVNVRNRNLLPREGPAIIAANHNSHLDTVALMSLVPLSVLHRVRPVAAADYWTSSPIVSWFSRTFINVVPIDRQGITSGDPLIPCYQALDAGDILLFFPEGSRRIPEKMSSFKPGLARLVEECPEARVVPVFLHGLGKTWPKGTALVVPFLVDVFVGRAMRYSGNRREFMSQFTANIEALAAQDEFPSWT
jgi:1-acyl-sn-glycerol-3-phosphate acyltransferase